MFWCVEEFECPRANVEEDEKEDYKYVMCVG